MSQTDPPEGSVELKAFRTPIRELQLEVDVLKEIIEVLKKTSVPIQRDSQAVKRQ